MHGRDRRLQSERAGTVAERFADERQGLRDPVLIPEAAILVFQEDQIARVVETGRPP